MLQYIFWGSSGWGGGAGSDGVGAVQSLNQSILTIVMYCGAVLIALGVTQLIMALHEQNPAAKSRAALQMGLGITFLTINVVFTTLGFNNTSGLTEQTVAQKALEVLGTGLRACGIVLIAIAIFQVVMAMANEDAREKADGTKTLAVGIALYGMKSIMAKLSEVIFPSGGGSADGASVVSVIFGIIVYVARYVGIGFAAIGLFQFVFAMKDGDGSAKAKAGLFAAVGAVLIAMGPVLNALNITF